MALDDSINRLSFDAEYIADIIWRLPGAEQVGRYYDMFGEVAELDEKLKESLRYYRLAGRIKECQRYWFFDHFQEQAVKDRKRVFMCHDKFCTNCQKVIAQVRKKKFTPALDKVSEEYDLYHFVLTNPNCTGIPLETGLIAIADDDRNGLKKQLRHMSECFKMLIRYFTGNAKNDLGFDGLGYAGVIRSLECSFKRYGALKNPDGSINENVYHPHYHCILALKKGLQLEKTIENKFSYSRNNGYRLFSEQEIMIQKVWRLLIDGAKRVSSAAADKLPEGYSCMLDKIAPGNYHEVFKYAIKLDKIKRSDRTKETRIYIPLRNFIDMYFALYKKRTIQGYGVFHNMKFDEAELDDILDVSYMDIITALKEYEQPVSVFEHPVEIYKNIIEEKCRYISRNNMRSLIGSSLAGIEHLLSMVGDKLRVIISGEYVEREESGKDSEQISFYRDNNILCHEDFEDFYDDGD